MTERPSLHPLVGKQLARAGIEVEELEGRWLAFVERVSKAYAEADLGRYRLERSVAISADEMAELAHSLASERDRLRAIFDSASLGITQADLDGRLQECNGAFAAMVGLSRAELLGRRWIDLVHPDEQEAMRSDAGAALDAPTSFERRYVHRDGRTIRTHVTVSTLRASTGEPIANIAIQRDVTLERDLEVSLRHAQKLQAVGQLAAGVAHEINTPLQFIGDNLAFLSDAIATLLDLHARARELVPAADVHRLSALEKTADWEYLRAELPAAVASSASGLDNVARIVRAMKVLAHQGSASEEAANVDLNAMLESVCAVAASETRYVADVSLDLTRIPAVRGFADDLGQVFLNLLVNAAHAVADVVRSTACRGAIRVRTEATASAVVVSISDTGGGIPEAIRDRIFEPFFTTKDVGRGTGQGLSLARAIVVEKHGGELTFESHVGRGTTFFVRLPLDGIHRRAA